METKQTAVEWYEIEINSLIEKYESKEISKREFITMKHNLFYQAKEMEKQQIIEACIETTQDCYKAVMAYMGEEIVFSEKDLINQRKEAEQYYNETFNK